MVIGQTDAYFSKPTVLISLLYVFRQCVYFSTVLISLPSIFQCGKFFQRVPKTLTTYHAIKYTFEIALTRYCLDLADQLKNVILKLLLQVTTLIFRRFCLKL